MPMELWLEMAAEHDVATEVMALVVRVLGGLNSRKMAHPHIKKFISMRQDSEGILDLWALISVMG